MNYSFFTKTPKEIILLHEMEKQKQERVRSKSTEIKQNVLFYSKLPPTSFWLLSSNRHRCKMNYRVLLLLPARKQAMC